MHIYPQRIHAYTHTQTPEASGSTHMRRFHTCFLHEYVRARASHASRSRRVHANTTDACFFCVWTQIFIDNLFVCLRYYYIAYNMHTIASFCGLGSRIMNTLTKCTCARRAYVVHRSRANLTRYAPHNMHTQALATHRSAPITMGKLQKYALVRLYSVRLLWHVFRGCRSFTPRLRVVPPHTDNAGNVLEDLWAIGSGIACGSSTDGRNQKCNYT